MTIRTFRLALGHCAPVFDDVRQNIAMLTRLVKQAAAHRPDLLLLPELALSGYGFAAVKGLNWIPTVIPPTIEHFKRLARQTGVAILLGTPTIQAETGALFNAALLIDADGRLAGAHHKLAVLPGSEGWAQKGAAIAPLAWGQYRLGVLICADLYPAEITAQRLLSYSDPAPAILLVDADAADWLPQQDTFTVIPFKEPFFRWPGRPFQ